MKLKPLKITSDNWRDALPFLGMEIEIRIETLKGSGFYSDCFPVFRLDDLIENKVKSITLAPKLKAGMVVRVRKPNIYGGHYAKLELFSIYCDEDIEYVKKCKNIRIVGSHSVAVEVDK